ncbi:hypothetical protein O9992_07860 [Vibrio lentus]|nr:hypothetical protein [Vibrio lentus]
MRPSRPLSIAVVASLGLLSQLRQFRQRLWHLVAMLAPFGVDYLTLLMVCIPTTFIACRLVRLSRTTWAANRKTILFTKSV